MKSVVLLGGGGGDVLPAGENLSKTSCLSFLDSPHPECRESQGSADSSPRRFRLRAVQYEASCLTPHPLFSSSACSVLSRELDLGVPPAPVYPGIRP